MGKTFMVRRSLLGILIGLGTVGLTTGCATKNFVRTKVDTSTHQLDEKLSARIDSDDNAIKTTSGQVDELNSVTRDHTQKISSLNDGLKQTDSKAQQAMQTGEGAQNTANKAVGEVSALDSKFQNRNHYVVLNEEQVRFKFNSAKLEPELVKVLDELAQQLKQNPDAILVMEGHTDGTGNNDYNIQLGQKRVEAVVRYLVVDQEVPMNRISDLSFGEARPIAPNKTKEGRAQNRSVVIRVMGPQLNEKNSTVSQTMPSEMETR